MARRSTREDLIKAGIEEINKYGINGFSMRRAAEACGISCGAPYKHFGNRKDFIAALFEYVNCQWKERRDEILEVCGQDLRRQIVELCVGYVQFLMEKPHFRAILTMKDDDFDDTYRSLRGELSSAAYRLVTRYCDSVEMPPEVRRRKIYVIRSLIYGAVIMFDNGELPDHEESMSFLRAGIDREFDLP